MSQHTVLLGMPLSAFARTFPAELQERLFARHNVLVPEQRPTTEDVTAMAEGQQVDAVVTTWGAPAFPKAFWQAHPECKFFGHMAGTVKQFFPDDTPQYLVDHGITVVCGQYGIGVNVAETAVGLMIALSRRWGTIWHGTRYEGKWGQPEVGEIRGLTASTVGIVAASQVGRVAIELLKPFRCKVLCYDPYLSDYEAGRLGVTKVDLNTLFAESDCISMHHPTTPETDRMVGKEQFDLIKDGAVFINTARPLAIDPDALLAAAQENRFQIALDVTEPEPLPADHALRSLPNVWIMPHHAGAGRYGYAKVGEIVMDSLDEYFAGKAITWRYPIERLEQMA